MTIGDGCTIGEFSVVDRSIPAYHFACGSPARPIRKTIPSGPGGPGLYCCSEGRRVLRYPGHTDEGRGRVDRSLTDDAETSKVRFCEGVSPRQIVLEAVLLVVAGLVLVGLVHDALY